MSTAPTYATDRAPFRKLRGKETCEGCGHQGWCMVSDTTVWCMRNADGAYATTTDKAGATVYLHHRGDAPRTTPIPIQRRDERPADEIPDPLACDFLYSTIAQRCAGNEPPGASRDADARRFGAHVAGVRAISDDFFILHPERLVAWIEQQGRTRDAKNAGVLVVRNGQVVLSPALLGRKVYAWRDEHGRVKDLRGRAYDGSTPKVRSLAGSREDRGADGVWYQHGRIAEAVAAGGHIRIAGGHEKADALNFAGLPTVGSNEGQASDAMIAALVSAGIVLVTLFADAEDPKPDRPISEGQRLALALGERLEAAGLAVRVAEAERAPGSPKLDADTILRDRGPGTLVALDRAALPLALYRKRSGAEVEQAPPTLIEDLRRQLLITREERDQAREEAREARRMLRAIKGTLANTAYKQVGRAAIGIAQELQERLLNTTTPEQDIIIDTDTGQRFIRMNNTTAGQKVGLSDDTISKSVAELVKRGKLEKITRPGVTTVRDRQTGELKEAWATQNYLSITGPDTTTWLEGIAELPPDEDTKVWGAKPGRPRCDRHPDAPTKTTTTRIVTCGECGEVLATTIIGEQFHDATGQPITPGEAERILAELPPALPYDDEDTAQPALEIAPPTNVRPFRASEHRPWCLNHRGNDKGCQHRVERHGDVYCPACEAEGYTNGPPRPPAWNDPSPAAGGD